MALQKRDLDKFKAALGKEPNAHEEKCYTKLKTLLNRDPLPNEIGNMKTDIGLQLQVLTETA